MSESKLSRFWLPKTLFGRLVVVLLVGLLIAQLLGAYILLRDRASSLYETSGWYTAQRFASIVELMDTLPTAQRQLVLNSLNTTTLHIAIESTPQLSASSNDPHAMQLRNFIARQLTQRPVNVAILDWEETAPISMPGMTGMHMMHSTPAHQMMMNAGPAAFQIEAQLRNGEWASMVQQLPQDQFLLPDKLLLTLAILLLSVIGLSLWVVRRVTRPLAILGEAAEALGRDITRPLLNEFEGPKEVQHAAQAFNTMQTRIMCQIQDRERFLAAVSHDLKTPITRLRLRAELLDDATLRDKILQDLKDMETMTAAALDFLRGAATDEPVKAVDVQALLESLQADMEEAGHSVQVHGHAQAPYPAQPLALKRLLTNLIDNAVKYGNSAEVNIEDSIDTLRIIIADEGPGLPLTELDHVFEPFHRLEESRNRDTGGVGLGLSVARDIARAHGGELVLRNGDSGGLEAILTLPRHSGSHLTISSSGFE